MRDEEIEEWYEAIIQPNGAFDPPTDDVEKHINRVRADIFSDPDEEMREIRADELRAAIAAKVYGGHDPKFVPNDVMKFCITNPSEVNGGFILMDTRRRVRNPNTGIRAKCLECQGNDQAGVRNCPKFNCPLWPFRMAGNPFFGRLVGSTGEEESNETEEEIEWLEAGGLDTLVKEYGDSDGN